MKPGVYLPRTGLHDVWIGLKFEKLSDLCLKCGILGHAEKECAQEKFFLTNQQGVKFLAYGEWIRLENDKVSPDIYSTKDCTETPQRVLNQKEDPPSTALGTPTLSVDTPNDNVGLSSMTREGTEQLDCAPAPECPKPQEQILSFAKLLAQSLQKDEEL